MGILHLTSNKIKKKEKSIYINSNDQIKVFYYTSNHTLENNDRKKEKENTTRRNIHIFLDVLFKIATLYLNYFKINILIQSFDIE